MTTPPPIVIPDEAYAPRDEANRYRVYLLKDRVLQLVATAPDGSGFGCAILAQHEAAKEAGLRLSDLGVLGLLDAIEREWIIPPFSRTHG